MTNQKQVLDVRVSKGITAAQSNEHLRDRSERAENTLWARAITTPRANI